ncbi:MAG TPA: hypothetical protein VES65_05680 [Solirubrobacteraceae bacterium]|nr:hypothetical protein [Solirubrobacteraceae bacterium]
MVFSIEAVNAKQGDCLLLHWGESGDPRLALIDGGPSGVYERWLRPRLRALAAERHDGPLALELVLVSHIDDDHVHGVLDLFGASVEALDDELDPPYSIERLWHNAFHALTAPALAAASVAAGDPSGAPRAAPAGAVSPSAIAASVGQGRRLQDDAVRLSVPINDGRGGMIVAPLVQELPAGLKLSVIAPSSQQLEALRKKWELEAARHGRAAALATAYEDTSVYNRSSIVLYAQADGRRMLLTGDARGDEILTGLQSAGIVAGEETLELDLLKVPHHGSSRNVEPSFFRRIRARHYVISADGKYDNPEDVTLQMILDSRRDDDFTLHLTNHDGERGLGERLDAFFSRARAQGRKFGLEFREPDRPSLAVHLGDPVEP